jgi:hypothetical protein
VSLFFQLVANEMDFDEEGWDEIVLLDNHETGCPALNGEDCICKESEFSND